MLFQQISVTSNGKVIAVAVGDDDVRFFEPENGRQTAAAVVPFDFGGERLLINSSGHRCYSASYEKRAVACTDVLQAVVLWSRTDLHQIQELSMSRDQRTLYCGLEGDTTVALWSSTGEFRAELNPISAKYVFESPLHDLRVHDFHKALTFYAESGRVGTVRMRSFAMIAHCFSPDFFCMSESAGNVRFFSSHSFSELWEHQPRADSHFMNLVYSGEDDVIWGMEWPYVHGGPHRFVEFRPSKKEAAELSVINVKGGIATFDSLGRAFAFDGRIFDIRTGEQIGKLQLV